MANRLVLILTAVAATLGCSAQEAVQTLSRHVRFEVPRTSGATVGLQWADSCRVEVDIPAANADDERYGVALPCRYYLNDSLAATAEARGSYRRAAAVSLVLRVWEHGAAVDVGTDRADATIPVAFDRLNVPSVSVYNPKNLAILRDTEHRESIETPQYVDPDSCQSHWLYLDRNTEAKTARLGGAYRLGLTAADSLGVVQIVYLGGASEHAGLWQPGRVKGRLKPTRFANHYDLEWITAAGRMAPAESYADLDGDTGILTLSLPLLGATVRFQRLHSAAREL